MTNIFNRLQTKNPIQKSIALQFFIKNFGTTPPCCHSLVGDKITCDRYPKGLSRQEFIVKCSMCQSQIVYKMLKEHKDRMVVV